MKKIKLKDALYLICAIIYTISVTIYDISQIPVVYETSINRFGLNIGLIITVVVGCILIALIVLCVTCLIKLIKCIFFYE